MIRVTVTGRQAVTSSRQAGGVSLPLHGSAALVGDWGDFGGTGPRAAAEVLCRGAAGWPGGAALLRSPFHPFPCHFLILGEQHVIVTALPQLTIAELK